MGKLAWFDCETSGLDASKHGILQLSMMIEDKGEIVDTFSAYMKPPEHIEIEQDALDINGITLEQIETFQDEAKVFLKFQNFLAKNVDYRKKGVNLTPCGYNVEFDVRFLQALFDRNTKVHYGAVFNYYGNDTFALVKILLHAGKIKKGENLKLGTMCQQFNVKLKNAHNSLSDIKATRKLHRKLVKKFLK